jgi:hypothetical protein
VQGRDAVLFDGDSGGDEGDNRTQKAPENTLLTKRPDFLG